MKKILLATFILLGGALFISALYPLCIKYYRSNHLQLEHDDDKKPAEKPVQMDESIKEAAQEGIPVLVNKQIKLSADYEPVDIIEPSIPFIIQEKSE